QFFTDTAASLAHKRERRKEARPGELLDAALSLFVEKGFAATRMEEVAKRAGVSKGTVFLYFPSKEELFKAVVRENISGRFEEWNNEFLTYQGSAADMLHHCMSTWWQRIGSTQASGITKLMISEGGHFPDIVEFYQNEVVQPGQALIRQVLQRGIDRGEFRAVNLDFAVYGVVAAMMFLILSKHSAAGLLTNVPLDPDAYIANQAAVMLLGLSANKSSGVKTAPSS
ncbi:MAG: TetR/AcrR family transcriptional regulator, partial [Polaromonas sp.]|nr:TetR/AcrR family transcriptional regulator [Polaromonas sp.]